MLVEDGSLARGRQGRRRAGAAFRGSAWEEWHVTLSYGATWGAWWDELSQRIEPLIARTPWRMVATLTILAAAILGVATQVLGVSFAATRHHTRNMTAGYHRGYYTNNGWLCYGWASGAYHCTAWWHQQGNTYISDNPAWVPNIGNGAGGSAVSPTSGASVHADSGPVVGYNTAGEPCTSTNFWVSNISQWSVPPGCYANVYVPNPANYVARPSFGWCNWWPEVMHPAQYDILWGSEHHRSAMPTPGAAVYFAPGVQGASSVGHYAQVIAVNPDRYWVLVAEMNFVWRGAGFGKLDYRYIHVGPGVTFIT